MHADDTYGIYAYIHWGNMNVTPVHRRMDGRTDGQTVEGSAVSNLGGIRN